MPLAPLVDGTGTCLGVGRVALEESFEGGLLRMNVAKSSYSLNEIENMYQYGMVTEEEVIEYLKSWNSGPHFTQAVLDGYRIRNFDPEKSGVLYRHLKEKFGLQL